MSSRLTEFYRIYCPLLKFSFPDFSLQSSQILTRNVVYELVLTKYRSSSRFVTIDRLLQELLLFAKLSFPDFSMYSLEILN